MKKFRKPGNTGKTPGKSSRDNASRGPKRTGALHRAAIKPSQPQNHRQEPLPGGRCVVGIHAVTELLKVRPKAVSQLWIREKYTDHPDLKNLHEKAMRLGLRLKSMGPASLDRVVSTNQGILAFTDEDPEINWSKIEQAERSVLIALDEVEDPHNLGAILRTAWLLGADGILTPEHRSAHLSPAVSKVAQGAVEHVPVDRDNALGERLKRLKQNGFWILGLSHKATQSLFKFEIPAKVVWVLGSEAGGLRKSTEGACDDLISIPQAAPEASYNVSVAAAMAMAETFRQHQSQSNGL